MVGEVNLNRNVRELLIRKLGKMNVFCHNKEHGKNDRHLLKNEDEKDFNANVAE